MTNERFDIDFGPGEKEGERSVIEVRVYYSKGGINYMSYNQEPRGYYVMVQICNVGDCFRSYILHPGSNKGGFKQCIEVVKRLNRKRLEQLQDDISTQVDRDAIKQLWELGQLRAIFEHLLLAAGKRLEDAA